MKRVTIETTATATVTETWVLAVPDDSTTDAADLLDDPAVKVLACSESVTDERDREFVGIVGMETAP